jgi:alpha-tubulin suppressor-like RCC1 family protein
MRRAASPIAVLAALVLAASTQAAWVGWGSNVGGGLGAGYGSFNPTLTPVGMLVTAPKEVVLGHALMPDGTVQAWGGNSAGQVGDGTRQRKLNPVTVPGLTGVTQIADSGEHMIALLSDGTVKTWGSNLFGQLGIGTTAFGKEDCSVNCRSPVPVAVPGLAGVRAVFAGGADDAALLNNGTAVAWGENKSGQLGTGDQLERTTPVVVRGLSSVKTLELGGMATLGGHIFALLNDGTVKALGYNGQGQLGIGTTVDSPSPMKVPALSGATAISTSWTHSLALVGGKLLAWGNNTNGELGVHTTTICGGTKTRKPCATTPVTVPLAGVRSIAAGYASSDVAAGGRAYSAGFNGYGQLGSGTQVDRSTFGLVSGLQGVLMVQAGTFTAFAEISGSVPPPIIEATAGAGTLTITWRATGGTGWIVTSRPFTGAVRHEQPFGPKTILPASARSYILKGTPGQPYEVSVAQTNGSFGRKVVEGTPRTRSREATLTPTPTPTPTARHRSAGNRPPAPRPKSPHDRQSPPSAAQGPAVRHRRAEDRARRSG